MSKILFFGDSITYGEYDGVFGGYADLLKRYAHTRYVNENTKEVSVFNLGIPSETTRELVNRIESEIKARISQEKSSVFLFYGANDLARKNNQYQIPLEEYVSNIEKAVKIAKKFNSEVFLISILPISEKINEVISGSGKIRSNADIVAYNAELKILAKKLGAVYVDLYDLFEDKKGLISEDGLHPTGKGYRLIADILKEYIDGDF